MGGEEEDELLDSLWRDAISWGLMASPGGDQRRAAVESISPPESGSHQLFY